MSRRKISSPVASPLVSSSFNYIYFVLIIVNISTSSAHNPEIKSYARVSTNRGKILIGDVKNSREENNEGGRSFPAISPIYVSGKLGALKPGEVVEHRSRKQYAALDGEKSDNIVSGKEAQERFHPPASFERVIAHSNALVTKPESQAQKLNFPIPSYATLPKNVYSSSSYDYPSDSKGSVDQRPAGDSHGFSEDSQDSFAKIPDSYGEAGIFQSDDTVDSEKILGFSSSSYYGNKNPSKPEDFIDHYGPYATDDEFNHDLIYDNPHHHYYHHHDDEKMPATTTTTEEPEINDQRLSKRPYSYYYIGKKLWYLPLYFSIYFIIYVAALVLKSITRHKINFPASLASLAADGRKNSGQSIRGIGWYDLTKRVLDGIDLYNGIGKS